MPLKEAERLEPNEPPILVALGTALNERKLYAEAKPPLLRALSLAPDNVEAMAALAEAEEGLGELQAGGRPRAAGARPVGRRRDGEPGDGDGADEAGAVRGGARRAAEGGGRGPVPRRRPTTS